MSFHRPRALVRSGMILAAGNVSGQIISLIRNMVVARMVGPEDFGVAVTFAVSLSILEAAFAHGFDKLLIQDKDGHNPVLQSMLHTLLVARGLISGLALYFAAPLLTQAFKVPEALLAYQLLALVPVIRGFAHLDVVRIQRDMQFGRSQMVQILSQLLGLAVAVVHAILFQSYWAMLWGILSQVIALVMLTQFAAERSYRLGWDVDFSSRIVGFSWPLMLNGIVLVLAAQADRLIVGAMLSLTDLAIYGAASMVVTAFLTLLAKVAGDLSLPWISEVRDAPTAYRKRQNLIGATISFGAILVFAPMALLGGEAVTLLFGEEYSGPASMIAWLAVAMGLRFLRVWPIIISMSFGDTVTLMRSNIIRGVGLIALFPALHIGLGVSGAAAAMALGEGMATLFAFLRMRRLEPSFRVPFVKHMVFAVAGLMTALAMSAVLDVQKTKIEAAILFIIFTVTMMVATQPDVRNSIRRVVRR